MHIMKNKMKKLIVGNWKMNPQNIQNAKEIFVAIRKTARDLNKVKTVICPPFVFLAELSKLVNSDRIATGGQNLFYEKDGSFTGEISASQLKSVGATYVIIGHSERRAMGETNEAVNKKVARALKEGLHVILCIGEHERDHAGHYLAFLKKELHECLVGVQKKNLSSVTIAYEPIWAIGKSEKDAMKPRDIHEMTIYIRKVLSDMFDAKSVSMVPVLYGGSVTSEISEPMFTEGQIDGLLIGRQSLDPEDFSEILKQANSL